MRFLSGRSMKLRHTFLDEESALTVASVSVTVVPVGSTTEVYTGNATEEDSEWSATVPAQPTGVYTVTWTAPDAVDVSTVEVVGGFLFTIPEARDSDRELTDKSNYPASELAHYREVVEQEFERVAGVSFTPRTTRLTVQADGTDLLWTGVREIRGIAGAESDGAALDVSTWTVGPSGFLVVPEGLEGAVTVTVDHGYAVPPLDVKRVALIRLRHMLAAETSGIPDRATSFSLGDQGNTSFALATPGRAGFETGIPEVDAVLTRYKFTVLNDVLGVS